MTPFCAAGPCITGRSAGGLVGAAGFEPATTSPPDWCATRLRHAPTFGESSRAPIAGQLIARASGRRG